MAETLALVMTELIAQLVATIGRAAEEVSIARGRLRRGPAALPRHAALGHLAQVAERLRPVWWWLLQLQALVVGSPTHDVDVLELRDARCQLQRAIEDVALALPRLAHQPVPHAMVVDVGRGLARAVEQLDALARLAWGPTTSSAGRPAVSPATSTVLVEPARNLVINRSAGAAHRAPVTLGRDARSRPMAKTKTTTRAKAKAKTKTKAKASTPKRDGLQPTSALGRALLSMIHLFLGQEMFNDETQKHLLVHGFIERSKYGMQYTTLGELGRYIARLLLSACKPTEGAEDEANKLAGQLVDEVFQLGQVRLKELVPATLAAVEREVSGKQEEAVAQREAKNKGKGGNRGGKPKAAKAPARAGEGSASKGTKAPNTAKRGKRAKAKPARAAVPPRLYDQAVAWLRKVGEPKSVPEIASHLGCDVTVATRIMDQMIDDDVWPSRSAAPTATDANDPTFQRGTTYAQGLAVLRKLGNQVDDAYAVDELEETLGISLERAEALLAAIKASGDWPRPSSSGKADAKTPAEEPEKESGSSQHDATFAAAERYVAEQERQGKRVTAAALKKELGVGHARAGKLLEQVRAAKTSPSAAAA